MQVSVRTQTIQSSKADLVVVTLRQPEEDAAPKGREPAQGGGPKLPPPVAAFDRAHGGAIAAAIERGDFTGKRDQAIVVHPAGKGAPARLLLVGLGRGAAATAASEREALRRAAGIAMRRAIHHKVASVAIALPKLRKLRADDVALEIATGAELGAYRFDKYRKAGNEAPRQQTVQPELTLLLDGKAGLAAARRAAQRGQILGSSQNCARDLSNEPPNELPPVELASAARKIAREAGLKCSVLDVAQMEKLGMGALLAVGRGSSNPPRLIVLEHVPKKQTRKTETLCLVGKGVTFDSGGISIKPAANMDSMKHDMSGAAAVVGAMRAVALLGLPQHVVGVVGAAENMPGGQAYRPGDVIRSMSGKTIEILNTDAEGRVVLADALHYAVTKFEPAAVVDLATLTGACVVALGPWASGLFTQDEALRAQLHEAGEKTGERLWPMPLLDEHKRAMHSTLADLKNAGTRDGGASTAAGFLSAFAGEHPWAHLDIAGTADTDKSQGYTMRGATGVGVRVLLEWLQSRRA